MRLVAGKGPMCSALETQARERAWAPSCISVTPWIPQDLSCCDTIDVSCLAVASWRVLTCLVGSSVSWDAERRDREVSLK